VIFGCPNCTVCHCVLTPEQKWPDLYRRPILPYTQEQIDRFLEDARVALEGEQLKLF
jgi:hypothetical protein